MARHHRPAASASLGDALVGGRPALGEVGEVASPGWRHCSTSSIIISGSPVEASREAES